MTVFNAQSTTDEVIRGHSLTGKLAVVTGASSGLGLETSRVLAAAGARVIMLARSQEKLDTALATIREALPQAEVSGRLMDLADLDSVRAAAEAIVGEGAAIHLLINNAGVMVCPLGRTAQGFETQFGTNHLGHFLFTCLLAPALQKGAPGRVVVLSSGGHKLGPVNLDDPNYTERDYDKWIAYGESKTANALFAVALDARLKHAGVRAFAVHPGVIMTDLARHMVQEDYDRLTAEAPDGQSLTLKSVPQGAATSIWAATTADLEGLGGLYLENCQIAKAAVAGVDGGVESYAQDTRVAEQLWRLSEELVGESFAF